MESAQGTGPALEFLGVVTMSGNWFEVVDGGVIVFAGPLEKCEDYTHSLGDYDNDLTVRPISF